MMPFIDAVRGGIIVSCQAIPGDPTFGSSFMVAFAKSALRGGAVGIRANGPEDISAIKAEVDLPLIGIWKRPDLDGKGVLITPTLEDACRVKAAGADIIALDASDRVRPTGLDAATLIRRVREEVGIQVMADCVTLEDAVRAEQAGADIAATTLSLPAHLDPYIPNFELLEAMVKTLKIPVIAEGHYWTPEDVEKGFALGAQSIVIGSAVTRPWLITERYAAASPRVKNAG